MSSEAEESAKTFWEASETLDCELDSTTGQSRRTTCAESCKGLFGYMQEANWELDGVCQQFFRLTWVYNETGEYLMWIYFKYASRTRQAR